MQATPNPVTNTAALLRNRTQTVLISPRFLGRPGEKRERRSPPVAPTSRFLPHLRCVAGRNLAGTSDLLAIRGRSVGSKHLPLQLLGRTSFAPSRVAIVLLLGLPQHGDFLLTGSMAILADPVR